MIYDLVIDDVVETELTNYTTNTVHPRRDPHNPDVLWETTLHFMVFDRPMLELIEKEIELDFKKENDNSKTSLLHHILAMPFESLLENDELTDQNIWSSSLLPNLASY